MTRARAAGCALAVLLTGAAAAQTPGPAAGPAPEASDGDTWIFSGALEDGSETFSGTLITGKSDTEFELKLAGGATCDGEDLRPALGFVQLKEIRCTDGRAMRALFVPQPHETLKVYGHVGDARFSTVAHMLGTEPIAEPPQTTAPHAPSLEPPAAPPLPAPSAPSKDGSDPG